MIRKFTKYIFACDMPGCDETLTVNAGTTRQAGELAREAGWASPRAALRGTTVDKRGKRAGGGASTIEHDVASTGDRGPINPNFLEQLMGFPIGWAGTQPLETRRFQSWLEQHGAS